MSISGESCSALFALLASTHTMRLAGSSLVTVTTASILCCANALPTKVRADAMAIAMACFLIRLPLCGGDNRPILEARERSGYWTLGLVQKVNLKTEKGSEQFSCNTAVAWEFAVIETTDAQPSRLHRGQSRRLRV